MQEIYQILLLVKNSDSELVKIAKGKYKIPTNRIKRLIKKWQM